MGYRLNIEPLIDGWWKNVPIHDVLNDEFNAAYDENSYGWEAVAYPDRHQILVAINQGDGYSQQCLVLYRDLEDGLFYEVNGSHCSCYGYEDQWVPEETDLRTLLTRKFYWIGHGEPDRETLQPALVSKVEEILWAVSQEGS